MRLLSAILTLTWLGTAFSLAILRTGSPLNWDASKNYLNHVRLAGVEQFIQHYHRVKSIETADFYWGDELEYGVFGKIDGEMYDLSLRGADIRYELELLENKYSAYSSGCAWQPEYGSWMVEAIPKDPYGGYVSDLLLVEKSMQLRRIRLHSVLNENEVAPSLSNFPMFGVPGYPHTINNRGPIANSMYISDETINPHPRFGALTRNIRLRRDSNVHISIPKENGNTDVVMDAMGFGMGCCCLQITMQCKNEIESRFLHDQLAIFAPYYLALSAATPIFKGTLVNTDTRWDAISQAVDDRTQCEAGESNHACTPDPLLVGGGIRRLQKSRYSSISRYITKPVNAEEEKTLQLLNDTPADIDEEAYEMLLRGGVDESLAGHIAHLFTRDPLVIFDDAIYVDDSKTLEHFENIQSTNWRSMRWKTPALEVGWSDDNNEKGVSSSTSKGPGWRIEFRPLEIQLTDFENAAFSLLTVLTTRCILAMGYNFYIPISYNEVNMKRATNKNAVMEQKFFIRRDAFRPGAGGNIPLDSGDPKNLIEVTLNELMNGNEKILGVIPAIREYLERLGCNPSLLQEIMVYIHHIGKKAAGAVPTTASWIRSFVKNHPDYQHDGKVPDSVASELVKLADDIGMGKVQDSKLLGGYVLPALCTSDAKPPYLSSNLDKSKLASNKCSEEVAFSIQKINKYKNNSLSPYLDASPQ